MNFKRFLFFISIILLYIYVNIVANSASLSISSKWNVFYSKLKVKRLAKDELKKFNEKISFSLLEKLYYSGYFIDYFELITKKLFEGNKNIEEKLEKNSLIMENYIKAYFVYLLILKKRNLKVEKFIIDYLDRVGNKSLMYTFKSGIKAFQALNSSGLKRYIKGLNAFFLAKKAIRLDKNNIYAKSLKALYIFAAPILGSKEQAKKYLLEALSSSKLREFRPEIKYLIEHLK